MARWHAPSCSSPHVCVGEDSIPKCSACGSSAHDQLQKLREHPPTSTSPIPPDEKPGQLNLSWPSSITYVRTARENNGIENQAAVLTDESRDSLQLPKEYPLVEHKSTPQKHDSIIHGSTLAADQLRLICLTAKDKDLPEDVIHLSLETHHDGETPYEAVSYTWGGEAGDDTLRHPIYIGEYWDILLQTRNCCAMLCYLRPFRGMRMFWVDAICINQRDVRERSSQVAKMGRIYSECYQVVLWLGDNIVSKRRPSVYPSRHLFHQLEDETVTLPIKEGNSPERSTIQRLLELRYFSRVWIIQELILAPRVVIPLGDKLFWVDPSMTTKLQHRTQGSWSWEETEAPWFQYATQGQLLHNSLHDLVTLTWQSQSSDLRDKIYGILGPVYSGHDVAPIKPDYGISLQHVLIGFFAHSIIVEKVAQLLFKASGASAEVGMPSWMPPWRADDAWGRLFSNGGEENTSWESVESCVEELRQTIQRENVEDIWKVFSGRWFRSDHRTSIPGLRTAFDDRPWYKDATVDADSGALSLYLTRLTSFAQAPVRASLSSGEGWYRYSVGVEQDIYILSRSNLGTVVKAGDEIFLLDTNFSQPIYLILRKTSNYEEFRLIAACPHLAMISLSSGGYDRVRAVPLAELHYSLDVDLRWLHHLLDQLDETGTRKLKKLFPGRRKENTTLREVLPLFLGAANDRFQNKFKSWKTFEQAYLDFLGPDFQPRVIDGVCELVVEPDLALGSKFSAEWVRSSLSSKPASKWLGWKKRKGKAGDRGKVIFSRSMSEIQDELDSKYFRFRGVTRPYVLDSNWLKCLLRILEGTDIGDRIMEKPLPEDRFQRGTHFTTDNVVKEFDLDGRTYKVCIL